MSKRAKPVTTRMPFFLGGQVGKLFYQVGKLFLQVGKLFWQVGKLFFQVGKLFWQVGKLFSGGGIQKKNQRRNLIRRFTTLVLPSVHGMDASKYYYCITSWCKAVTNEVVWFGIKTVGVPLSNPFLESNSSNMYIQVIASSRTSIEQYPCQQYGVCFHP